MQNYSYYLCINLDLNILFYIREKEKESIFFLNSINLYHYMYLKKQYSNISAKSNAYIYYVILYILIL